MSKSLEKGTGWKTIFSQFSQHAGDDACRCLSTRRCDCRRDWWPLNLALEFAQQQSKCQPPTQLHRLGQCCRARGYHCDLFGNDEYDLWRGGHCSFVKAKTFKTPRSWTTHARTICRIIHLFDSKIRTMCCFWCDCQVITPLQTVLQETSQNVWSTGAGSQWNYYQSTINTAVETLNSYHGFALLACLLFCPWVKPAFGVYVFSRSSNSKVCKWVHQGHCPRHLSKCEHWEFHWILQYALRDLLQLGRWVQK